MLNIGVGLPSVCGVGDVGDVGSTAPPPPRYYCCCSFSSGVSTPSFFPWNKRRRQLVDGGRGAAQLAIDVLCTFQCRLGIPKSARQFCLIIAPLHSSKGTPPTHSSTPCCALSREESVLFRPRALCISLVCTKFYGSYVYPCSVEHFFSVCSVNEKKWDGPHEVLVTASGVLVLLG